MPLETLVPLVLTILGLSVFEIVNSVDNAVVNAEVLATMHPAGKRWFLTWGIFFAVVVVRGVLPLLIVWAAAPRLGLWGALTATFSADPAVASAVAAASPVLLMGGGTFLVFLFLHWLFIEDKRYGIRIEKFIAAHALWFYATSSLVLMALVWFTIHINPILAFGATVGSTAFFLIQGFKENAEKAEKKLLTSKASDFSKLLYLEMLDLTFSIDSVLGAFAFTFAVPLIIIGNGIGAIVLRQITVGSIDRIKKYAYLKNGALYSIFALGVIMLIEAFGTHVPYWVSPVVTFVLIGFFFMKSTAEKAA